MQDVLALLHDLTLSKLPRSVVENAKWCVLDSLGCGLYGSQEPWSKIIASEMGVEAPRGSSVVDAGTTVLLVAQRDEVSHAITALTARAPADMSARGS